MLAELWLLFYVRDDRIIDTWLTFHFILAKRHCLPQHIRCSWK